MTAPDAPQNHTFDAKFSDLCVRGATWVEYWLQLDDTPTFNAPNCTPNVCAPNVQILHENRCVGGAAVAARALWNWGLAAQLETALGDDANAKFARRTVENDWQQVAVQGKIPALKLANLSEREQAYRVHLCAPRNGMANRARLEHGFCDETLCIQWQDNRGARCVEWRAQQCWLDGEALSLQHDALHHVAGGVQVLAAAICRAVIENRSWDELEKVSLQVLAG